MLKKLAFAGALGTISAQQLLVVDQSQLQALLNLQHLATPHDHSDCVKDHASGATGGASTDGKLSVMQMYERSLQWSDDIIKHSADLDGLIRTADNFISQNTAIFAEFGDNMLAKAFQQMSQVVVDTKNTLRDVQAYARQLKDRLGDAAEYLTMIQIPEGAAPTSDDMEILDMVLGAVQEALAYSGKTTPAIRADFAKIHVNLNAFGAHLKEMIGTAAGNIDGPKEQLLADIKAGKAEIARLHAKDPSRNCGLNVGDQLFTPKKSECKKIEETLQRKKEDLREILTKENGFANTYPMLQLLAGLDKFMASTGEQNFETQISEFVAKYQGQSILHTLPEPEQLAVQLTSIVEKAKSIEKEAEKTSGALDVMFSQTVGRHRFARQLQNLWSFKKAAKKVGKGIGKVVKNPIGKQVIKQVVPGASAIPFN